MIYLLDFCFYSPKIYLISLWFYFTFQNIFSKMDLKGHLFKQIRIYISEKILSHWNSHLYHWHCFCLDVSELLLVRKSLFFGAKSNNFSKVILVEGIIKIHKYNRQTIFYISCSLCDLEGMPKMKFSRYFETS